MSVDKHGIGNVQIVRSIGKRAIRVVLRPTFSKAGYNDEEYIINLAAKFAIKKGWKTIYVEPDQIDNDSVRVFNSHQFFHEANVNGYPGKYLCMADAGPYNVFNDPEFVQDMYVSGWDDLHLNRHPSLTLPKPPINIVALHKNTIPNLIQITNKHGHIDFVEENDSSNSPVCSQCRCLIMLNVGMGTLCGQCRHEFDIECEHDYNDGY